MKLYSKKPSAVESILQRVAKHGEKKREIVMHY